MENHPLADAVQRISEMEQRFDELLRVYAETPSTFLHDVSVQNKLRMLTEYYEGGQWMADYLLDEQGLLPDRLKRGVLSEDGVYNLLSDLQNENLI